jgi:hypothetical protein
MHMTIDRTDRDALYDGLMTDLTAIGDIFSHLHNDEPLHAKRLQRRFEVELRINSRSEVLPTYRVGAPTVCAPTSSLEPTEVNANRFAGVAGGQILLDDNA